MWGKGQRRHDRTFLAVLAVIFLVLVVSVAGPSLDILPGFEGEQNGLYGYQPDGQAVATLGNQLHFPTGACGYAWSGNPTISAASVKATFPSALSIGCATTASATLDLAAQENPVVYTNPYTTPIVVNYAVHVPGSTTQYQYVTGNVEEYTYTISVAIEGSSAGGYAFPGDTVWLNLASVVWNQAVPDPNNSSVTGSVFEAPLYGVVQSVKWTDEADSNCNLCTEGAALTFYSSPSTTGQTLATLTQNQAPSTSLNSSLSSVYAPDSRLQKLVYYPLVIDHFENNCVLDTCQPPTATITILLYTLRIGEYILTNPDTTQLHPPPTDTCIGTFSFACSIAGALGGLDSFLSNPFGQISTVIIIVAILIVAILLLSAFLKIRFPIIGVSGGRPRGG